MVKQNKILAQEWFDAARSDYQYAEVGLKEDKEEIIEAFENARFVKETIESILVKPLSEKP